ncbi:hypothetical protein NHE_0882 [Neorickettsia helminthoeca str. Oregon]|uniref:Uncharacterized protein n=1 Tax=Neorickettsia helminthoeca str. Oregon TaxID=1286528 RepID=X5H5D5_9RICK|nr:hypothetical protein [Neorickettsia helminthoeca]AHX11801.1 hypothetical protein NHE_0882 [Neorickettsia helminthoeca str. Oregon]
MIRDLHISGNFHLDFSFFLSLLLHLLVLVPLSFSGKINLQKLADTSTFIVLDSIQITDVTNLKLRDTSAGISDRVDKKAEKKFATVTVPDDSKTNDLVVPDNDSRVEVEGQDGPALPIKRSKSKPVKSIKIRKPISSQQLKEDDELAGLLQSLDEKTTAGSVQNDGEKSGAIGKGKVEYDPRKGIGIDVVSSIRSRFINCWRVPIAAMDVDNVIVTVNMRLGQGGELISAEIVDDEKYNENPFMRVLADSALRAVYLCTPMENLPKDQFEAWRDMQLRFNVADML